MWANRRDSRGLGLIPRQRPALPVTALLSFLLVCERVCNRCAGPGNRREDFYTFCTFVTREICLCYFSAFPLPGVLRLGWEGEGDRGKEVQNLAPFGLLANHVLFFLILLG